MEFLTPYREMIERIQRAAALENRVLVQIHFPKDVWLLEGKFLVVHLAHGPVTILPKGDRYFLFIVE